MGSDDRHDVISGLLSRLIPVLAGLAFISLLVFGVLTAHTSSALSAENDRLKQVLVVRSNLLGMLSGAFAMEATHNEYLLTGDPALIDDFAAIDAYYASHRQDVQSDLDSLPETLRPDVDAILARIGQQHDGFSELFRQGQIDRAAAADATARYYGAAGDTSVLAPYGRFQSSQAALADRSTQTIRTLQRRLAALVIASLLTGLLIGLFLLVSIRRAAAVLATSRSEIRTAEAEVATAYAAQDHAKHEQERVESLLEDMNHRVGNSLGMVSALMGLQRSRSQSEEVRDALDAARARIHSVATAHRRLRLSPDLASTDLHGVLDGVAADLVSTMPRQDMEVVTDFVPLRVSDRDAVTIGLLMSEGVTNAFKHAFAGRKTGTVTIRTELSDSGTFSLHVEDDGVGMPTETHAPARTGLGTSVITRMSAQYGGELRQDPRPGGGTHMTITLPKLQYERV